MKTYLVLKYTICQHNQGYNKKLHVPNVGNDLVINLSVILYISNILKMYCVNQNTIHAYGMCRCWQNLIELQSIAVL